MRYPPCTAARGRESILIPGAVNHCAEMLRAVGFDLDGTLFDDRQYARAGLEAAGARVAQATGTDLTAALLTAYFDRGIREGTFDVVLDEHDLPSSLVPDMVEAYHDNDAVLTPYPATVSTLSALADSYRLGLLTGGTNGREKLTRLGLADRFDAVVTTADRDCSKRESDPFVELAEELGVAADGMAYVGDRPELDSRVPNRLGMYTIRVRTGQWPITDPAKDARPDVVVDSIGDVPDALQAIA